MKIKSIRFFSLITIILLVFFSLIFFSMISSNGPILDMRTGILMSNGIKFNYIWCNYNGDRHSPFIIWKGNNNPKKISLINANSDGRYVPFYLDTPLTEIKDNFLVFIDIDSGNYDVISKKWGATIYEHENMIAWIKQEVDNWLKNSKK